MNIDTLFNKLNREEKKLLIKINKQIESSRSSYKRKVIEDITKKQIRNFNYYVDEDITKNISKDLFSNIDELNIRFFESIEEYYYNKGVKEIEEVVEEQVDLKFKKSQVNAFLIAFILGEGINYNYKNEIQRRMEYFNSRIVNSIMADINYKVKNYTQEQINKEYKSIIKNSINMNSNNVNSTIKGQKKGLGNFIDNVAVFIATESMLQAYKDYGVEYVMRVSERDNKVCKTCASLDGMVYPIDKIDDSVPSHPHCRCGYVPIIEN